VPNPDDRTWLSLALRPACRLTHPPQFDLAIDSKPRGCDVVRVRIGDVLSDGRVRDRATIVQQKAKRPVRFELMDTARKTIRAWLVAWTWRTLWSLRSAPRSERTRLRTSTTSRWLLGTGYTVISYRSQVDLNGKRDQGDERMPPLRSGGRVNL
jgi:hypothetical protein